MKIKDILQMLKFLLAISEQVTEVISSTAIPASEQEVVKKEVDFAVGQLLTARSKIEVDPD